MNELRAMNVRPHVAQNLTRRGGSAIDGRTTRHRGYARASASGKRIEEGFGWMKTGCRPRPPDGARLSTGSAGRSPSLRLLTISCALPKLLAETRLMARRPAFAKAFAGRWRIVEMDTWSDDVLDVGGEAHLSFAGGLKDRRDRPSSPSRHSSMSPLRHERRASDCRVHLRGFRRGRSDLRTWLGQSSEPPGASSGTSTSTTATILASSASRDDFFNSLLGIDFDECGADRAMAQDFAQNPRHRHRR